MTATTLETVLQRDRMIVGAALTIVALLAWGYTVWLARTMDTAAALHPWTAAEFGLMFVMWAVMMVGMMLPSAAPMILTYARVGRQAALRNTPLAATGFFAAGYLLAWTAFSLMATLGQWVLQRGLLLTPMMTSASAVFSGLVLVAAGAFQWTPLKNVCLKPCQSPLVFIQRYGGFRRSPLESLRLGYRHGLYCVGCCWALMALLFVGGVMSIMWVAAISAFVLAEKVVPAGRWFPRLAGTVLIGWGIWIIAGAA